MALSRAWQRALLRPSLSGSSSSVRLLHSSRIAKDSHSASGSHQEDNEHYPTEGFSGPIWRNSLLFIVAFAGVYRLSTLHADPHPARSSSSGLSAPGNESEDNDHVENDEDQPFLTRYMRYYSTPSSVWRERNERHLELVREKAEEKLLFQDAERPPVHRLRYASTFEQASPHKLSVGSQIDLSDVKVKKASE